MSKTINIGSLGTRVAGDIYRLGVRAGSRRCTASAHWRYFADDSPQRPPASAQRIDESPDGRAVTFEELVLDVKRQRPEWPFKAVCTVVLRRWLAATLFFGVEVFAFAPGGHDLDYACRVSGDEEWGGFTGIFFTDDFEVIYGEPPPKDLVNGQAALQSVLALRAEVGEWLRDLSLLSRGVSSVLAVRMSDAKEFFDFGEAPASAPKDAAGFSAATAAPAPVRILTQEPDIKPQKLSRRAAAQLVLDASVHHSAEWIAANMGSVCPGRQSAVRYQRVYRMLADAREFKLKVTTAAQPDTKTVPPALWKAERANTWCPQLEHGPQAV